MCSLVNTYDMGDRQQLMAVILGNAGNVVLHLFTGLAHCVFLLFFPAVVPAVPLGKGTGTVRPTEET